MKDREFIPGIKFGLAFCVAWLGFLACASSLSQRAALSLYRDSVIPIAISATETAIKAQEALEAIKASGIYDPALRPKIEDALTTPATQAMLDTLRRTQERLEAVK